MLIYPAIDLYEGKAVRLLRGDYANMTVYSEHPEEIALDFQRQGAQRIHLVDLEGAKSGLTPNFDTVLRIKKTSGLFCEIGGGVRTMDVIRRYLDAGIDRVILGTAAVASPGFVEEAAAAFGEQIAVGVDVRDGYVAVKGWTEKSEEEAFAFCRRMNDLGVRTLICTDISRDGAMQGTNLPLYKELSESLGMQIIASGGVSSLQDVKALRQMNLHGAIIGKAYYTGAISLREAIEVAQ